MAKKNKKTPELVNGMTKRQAKMAAREAERAALAVPSRPFEGVAGECDLVAMREFVPSATAVLNVKDSDKTIHASTILPGAVAALTRTAAEGSDAFVAMQVQGGSTNIAADIASAVSWASSASAGATLNAPEATADTPALADLLDPATELAITVHKDFSWWIAEGAEPSSQAAGAIEHANSMIMPSDRVEGVNAAWWVDAGDRAHIRWVRPENEDDLFNAIAKVHAAGNLNLGEGSKFAGSFRVHGLLVPVFDLDQDMHAQEWSKPLQVLDEAISQALADSAPLTSEQRRSRDGLRSRQVTLRY